jgi:hypothetical protein
MESNGTYVKPPLVRMYIMGRLCDVFGCWDSGDEPYSGHWLDLDSILDVETGAYWPDADVQELAETTGERGLFDSIEAEARLHTEQIGEIRWPDWYTQDAARGEVR